MYLNFNNTKLPTYSRALAAPIDDALGSWFSKFRRATVPSRGLFRSIKSVTSKVIIPRIAAPRTSWLKSTINRSAKITSPTNRQVVKPTRALFRAIRSRALHGTTPIEELSGLSGNNLGAWYGDLLQVGTSLFTKYQAYTDVQKQKKAATEYNKLLEEQSRLRAIQQVQAQTKATGIPATGPTKAVTTVAGINITYLLLGGIGIGAVLLLRK